MCSRKGTKPESQLYSSVAGDLGQVSVLTFYNGYKNFYLRRLFHRVNVSSLTLYRQSTDHCH